MIVQTWRNGLYEHGRLDDECVSRFDSAMMYGDACFTMMRTFNGVLFQLDPHIGRLCENMRALGIEAPVVREEIAQACRAVADYSLGNEGFDEVRLVVTASRGTLPMYAPHVLEEPWVSVVPYPLRWVLRGKSHLYDGVDAVISDVQAIPDECFPQQVKHTNRIHFRLAEQRAGAAWPILLTADGYLAEAPGANVAIVVNGIVKTPARNCLRGISMRTVAGIWQGMEGVGAFEWCDLDGIDLRWASEAFFTCTPFGMLPIRTLDGRALECPGPVYKRIMERWVADVGVDFVAQAKRWDQEA